MRNNLLKGIKTNNRAFLNYFGQRPLASEHVGPTNDRGLMEALRDGRTRTAKANEPSVLARSFGKLPTPEHFVTRAER